MQGKSFKLTKSENENKSVKLFLQLLAVLLFALLGIMFVYFGFAQKENTSIIYNETGEADYKVFLKENDYYSSKYLDKGMSYVANLIDYVNLSFNYNLNSSREATHEYKYKINAELIITERGEENKVLFRKPIVLKEETTVSADTNGNINEALNIKYDDYNAMVNNYRKEYSLSISSKLVVTMHVDTMGEAKELEGASFNSSNDLVISIPLSEQTIEINFDANSINNSKEIVQYSTFNPINYIYMFLGIVLFISALIFLIKTLTTKKQQVSRYAKKRNSILREYDRFIVETVKLKGLYNDKVQIPVNSFDELLDARDNTQNPILFYEDLKENISKFIVIDNNNMFIYLLRESDFKD